MSNRSKLDKQKILQCLDDIASGLERTTKGLAYIADDLEVLRKHIDAKEWVLKTPRKTRQGGGA